MGEFAHFWTISDKNWQSPASVEVESVECKSIDVQHTFSLEMIQDRWDEKGDKRL